VYHRSKYFANAVERTYSFLDSSPARMPDSDDWFATLRRRPDGISDAPAPGAAHGTTHTKEIVSKWIRR
jgi:hypothetical protein